MTQVSGSPGEFALGSLNDSTGWLQLSGLAGDPGFNITGTFVGTISFQVSNQSNAVKTRYSTPATYTGPAGPLGIPRQDGRWFRFIMTAYTSGTAYIGITAPGHAGSDGTPASISPQLDTNVPVGDLFS